MHLHCDNCCGQTKNNFVLWNFAWRVLTGRHTEVTLNFMPAGHTKFAPDWCSRLLKHRFRRSAVSCLQDLCEVIKQSTAVSGINSLQIVGKEGGTVIVKCYD